MRLLNGRQTTNAGADVATNPENYSIKTWSLKRTANYGSNHYDEKTLTINRVTLGDDARSIQIDLPEVAPTWCMEIRYSLRSKSGLPFSGTIHNTIHNLSE